MIFKIPLPCSVHFNCVLLLSLLYGNTVGDELGECSVSAFENTTYKFNIWVLTPFGSNYKFGKPRAEPMLELAFNDAIQTLARKLPEDVSRIIANKTEIDISYKNTFCDADVAVTVAADVNEDILREELQCNISAGNIQDINVMFGIYCDYISGRVVSLANHWDYLAISVGSRTSNLDTKQGTECCSTFIRTGVTETDFGNFTFKFFSEYNFRNIEVIFTGTNSHGAHVTENLSTDCNSLIDGVTDRFRENKTSDGVIIYNLSYWDTDADLENNTEKALDDLRSRARVSLWCVGRRTMRKMMQAAEKAGMTDKGDYAFFYIDMYNTNSSYYWTDNDDHIEFDSGNQDDEDRSKPHTAEYLRALTILSLKTPRTDAFANYSNKLKENILSSSNGEVVEYDQFVNPFLTFGYDAVSLLVSNVISDICKDETNFTSGETFATNLRGSTFKSLDREVTIGHNGDAIMDYSVLDMNPETNKFEVVMYFYGVNESLQEVGKIDWPGDIVPPNKPACGYVCPDNTIYFIIGAGACAFLIALVVIILLCRKVMLEKRLQMKLWKVKWEEIDWTKTRRNSSVSGSKESSYSISSSNAGFHHNLAERQKFTTTGILRGNLVAVKEFKRRTVSLNRNLLVELKEIYTMEHDHICKFIGAVEEAPHVSIITEYCPRGSLQDLLEDDQGGELEDVFKNSLIGDIIKGMAYLHRSYFHFHGNLKSSNCLIDSRFVVKLTDFGLEKFRENCRVDSSLGHKKIENKLWTAPEHLRMVGVRGSQKGDVYSFAIIVQEIVYQKGVFYITEELNAIEILERLKSTGESNLPFRPTIEDNDDVVWNNNLKKLVRSCWTEQPEMRPTFSEIQKTFKKTFKEKSLVDSLLRRLENYSQHLEEKVEERTFLYKGEKERADNLLYQMLPRRVAEQLKKGNNVLPMAYESVTIFFSDIVGFTAISHGSKPMEVVQMLNDLYTMFDQIIDKFDVYKVETIGDAYMVVSGLPEKNGNLHAREIARMSLSLIDGVKKFKIAHMPDTHLKLRVGMHTGPVVAGVVGLKMPRYCLFGDTVNTASRMESNGKALSIHVSPKTKIILDDFDSFQLEEREDKVFLKGLGTWKTWWLVGEEPTIEPDVHHRNSRLIKPDIEMFSLENETLKSTKTRFKSVDSSSDNIADQNMSTKTTTSPRPFRNKSVSDKRHRSGMIVDKENFQNTLQEEEKTKSVNFANQRLQVDMGSKPSYSPRSLPKVKFVKDDKKAPEIVSDEPQSGRDSGIGIGYENPELLFNSDSETDQL